MLQMLFCFEAPEKFHGLMFQTTQHHHHSSQHLLPPLIKDSTVHFTVTLRLIFSVLLLSVISEPCTLFFNMLVFCTFLHSVVIIISEQSHLLHIIYILHHMHTRAVTVYSMLIFILIVFIIFSFHCYFFLLLIFPSVLCYL